MCKPDLVVCVRFELVTETESEVVFRALAYVVVILHELSTPFEGDLEIRLLKFVVVLICVGHLVLTQDLVRFIGNVDPTAEPIYSFFLVTILGPDARSHAIVVKTCRLSQIKDIETNCVYFLFWADGHAFVDNFEVEPLCMAACICVILKP